MMEKSLGSAWVTRTTNTASAETTQGNSESTRHKETAVAVTQCVAQRKKKKKKGSDT